MNEMMSSDKKRAHDGPLTDDWLPEVRSNQTTSLLDKILQVSMTEIRRFRSAVPVKHGKVDDVVGHLGEMEAVLVLLALPNERGAAHIGKADLGNGLAVADAGRQQDGLVDAIVPDAKRVPGGGFPAAVGVETCAAAALV